MKHSNELSRREFLFGIAGASGALIVSNWSNAVERERSGAQRRFKKAIILGMLPRNMPLKDRFKLARDVGFDGIEVPPQGDRKVAEEMRATAEAIGLQLHSVIYGGWRNPLSSANPKVVEAGLKGVEQALHTAKWVGATAVLLVPGIVNARTRYVECYERTQRNIKRLIPVAEKLNVIIAIENVWNNFLLSPLEFARYIDEFNSPFVRAYFDVGNVVKFGWPQDWIRTLGSRIVKVHLKDYKRNKHAFVPLLEGDVDWREVRRAFVEVGYSGYLTAELRGGDEAYLRDVSARIDKIIAGR